MKIVAAQKMPDRHFYLLRHHILFYIYFWFSVYWCQIEINILIWRKRSLSRRLWVYDFCILNTLRSRRWIWYFFFFLTILNLQLVRMGILQKALTFTAIFLWWNSSLIKNHNLLANPLLFPTEITNLLFVIKTRQPLK